MRTDSERLNVRCSSNFVRAVDTLAMKEKITKTEFIKRAVRGHNDSIWGSLKLLKELIPIVKEQYLGDVILEDEE